VKLKLTIEVPANVDEDEALKQLLLARVESQGLTLVTPRRHYMDVDLVDVERGV
jgi:hypothetical protein